MIIKLLGNDTLLGWEHWFKFAKIIIDPSWGKKYMVSFNHVNHVVKEPSWERKHLEIIKQFFNRIIIQSSKIPSRGRNRVIHKMWNSGSRFLFDYKQLNCNITFFSLQKWLLRVRNMIIHTMKNLGSRFLLIITQTDIQHHGNTHYK